MKILNDCPNESKEPLLKLHKSLNTNSVEVVLNCVEAALGPHVCDMILRRLDKKKERYVKRERFPVEQPLMQQIVCCKI
jgi:hypothetical protein